jgi:hypothetical protein
VDPPSTAGGRGSHQEPSSVEVFRLQPLAAQLLKRHGGHFSKSAAECGFGALIAGQIKAQGITGAEEGGQGPVAPIALEPEAAAEHQLDQGLQGPGATLAGPQLLPADAREIDHRDLTCGGNSCRQAAINDAAQPQRRTLLVIGVVVAQAEQLG